MKTNALSLSLSLTGACKDECSFTGACLQESLICLLPLEKEPVNNNNTTSRTTFDSAWQIVVLLEYTGVLMYGFVVLLVGLLMKGLIKKRI
jgi:hypothetical protein